jgi:hypothetical protein
MRLMRKGIQNVSVILHQQDGCFLLDKHPALLLCSVTASTRIHHRSEIYIAASEIPSSECKHSGWCILKGGSHASESAVLTWRRCLAMSSHTQLLKK